MKFTYKWSLKDLAKVKKNGLKVFSCFACGGGSTMGYKMSGFEVIGCNEIDPEMIEVYRKNHSPKYSYLEGIQDFKKRNDLPKEFFELDVLDGSPPCSSFSMSGSREKEWGNEKKFREGQSEQVLDDLFFHFIDLAKKLRPKVVVAENVKGMLVGNAKGYVKQVISGFSEIGYDVQLFLLNGASMGLPQSRERVFFICRRRDLKLPALKLEFNERPIPVKEAIGDIIDDIGADKSKSTTKKYWDKCVPGKSFASVHPKGSLFNWYKIDPERPFPTIASSSIDMFMRWDVMATFTTPQVLRFGSFPSDYQGKSEASLRYQVGMSVPPIMMHKISDQIFKQWFNCSTWNIIKIKPSSNKKEKRLCSKKLRSKKDSVPTEDQPKKQSRSSKSSRKSLLSSRSSLKSCARKETPKRPRR